jgi:hypothetical protein
MPDRVRLTVGGTIGTAFGFDNFNVTQVPTPAASLLLLTGGLALMRRPRR